MEIFKEIFSGLVLFFEFIAVIIVVWGGTMAVISFAKFEFLGSKEEREHALESLRVKFGQKILISLEFFVASDLIKSVFSPSLEQLAQLGAFVAIRTVLSYFLNHEIREIRERHWKTKAIHEEVKVKSKVKAKASA